MNFIGLIILQVKKCVIVSIVIVLRTQNKKCLLEEWQVCLVIFFLYFNFIGTIVEILRKQFKWDETELDWICSRIAEKDTMLDPSKFYTQPIAYIDNVKNYYFLES